MCTVLVVVRNVYRRETSEVLCVEHDDVVEELESQGAYESLGVPVHPGFFSELVEFDADIGGDVEDVAREEGIGVADEATALTGVLWESLAELLQDPAACRLSGHCEVTDLPAFVIKDEEYVVSAEEDVVDGEEVHRRNLGRVVAEEGGPGLVGERLGVPRAESGEIAGDSGFAHAEFEVEGLAVDARGAPSSVLVVQALNGLPDRKSDRRRPLRFRMEPPERAKASAMTAEDRFRRDDHEDASP
jgi:hypothetical protein